MPSKLLLAVAVAVLLTACAPAPPPDELAEIRQAGRMVAFGLPDQHSRYLRFMVEEHGEAGLNIVGGLDADYLRRFTDTLGVRLEFRTVARDELPSFRRLFDEFVAHPEAQILAGAITVTEARRAKGIVFSTDYMEYRESLLARRGAFAYTGPSDLAGRTAIVMEDSSHHEFLEAFGVPLEFRFAAFYSEYLDLLPEHEGSFAPLSTQRAEQFAEEHPDTLEVVHTFPDTMKVAFGLKREGPLLDALNAFLLETRGY